MKLRTIALVSLAGLAQVFCFAQDRATLDLLVSKNLITREEADKLSKTEASKFATVKNKDTQKFAVSGLVQTQYQWINTHQSSPVSTDAVSKNGFLARRLFIGISGELASGFSAVLISDLAASGSENSKYIDAAYIAKKIESEYINGSLKFGYSKVNFGFEENTSATKLTAIERSITTRYFVDEQKQGSGNVGFGSRYTGVFWNGSLKQVEGLAYGFAVTNSQNFSVKPSTNSDYYDNTVNAWANVVYKNNFDIAGELINYRAGLNFGYGNGANSRLSVSGTPRTENGYILGVNPYLELKWSKFTLWSDFIMTEIQHGNSDGVSNSSPYGFNIAVEYRFDAGDLGEIAPAFRYSYLYTDGRGARISDGMNGAPNIYPSSSLANNLYNKAQSVYIGVNWYIIGDSVKLQAGYEWASYEGSVFNSTISDKKTDVNAVRVQMQVIF